ncbi:hypothetical protein BASA83_011639 [Batrachochytrium salamandrivorans]|nr:hypothetical protein BASA83_011639 [Batrachochytrium salamandrivorans]
MISLVQVLITAVLVPVAFAADPTPTHAAPAAATTCPVTRLPVSPDGQCGGGLKVSPDGTCAEELITNVGKDQCCSQYNAVEQVKSTVVMTVRIFWYMRSPIGSSKDTMTPMPGVRKD